MNDKFYGNEARNIVQNSRLLEQAYIDLAQSDAPQIVRTVTFKLDSARGNGNLKKLGFSFKSVYVSEATDSAVQIELKPFSDASSNDSFPLKKNGVLNFDLPIKNAFFKWEAQAGKEITLIFLLNGTFRPGSLFTEVSSSVEGNSISVESPVAISATPTLLVPQDLNRTVLHIDASVAIQIGPSASGNFFPIAQKTILKNTAEIWIRTISGAGVVQVMEEK